jgi:Putative peptidoglycan binding domain
VKRSSSHKKTAKARGQQKIDSERAQEIQEALIREHYLTGEATGTWNQASEDAMRRFQADQGWQTKQVPDSRALIKLGLGPNKDHLLNPESAMTTSPDAPRASSLPATSTTSAPVSAGSATDASPAASSVPHDAAVPQ